jgi:hypothetical protein
VADETATASSAPLPAGWRDSLKAGLVELADERGLPTDGSKDDLLSRLTVYEGSLEE